MIWICFLDIHIRMPVSWAFMDYKSIEFDENDDE